MCVGRATLGSARACERRSPGPLRGSLLHVLARLALGLVAAALLAPLPAGLAYKLPKASVFATSHGMKVAADRGCGHSACNMTLVTAGSGRSTGRAAIVLGLCPVPNDIGKILASMSCDRHDVFIINKCSKDGGSIKEAPAHLAACTEVMDWSWCLPGYKHCTYFYFMVSYYDRMPTWDVVYFLKHRHNGFEWGHHGLQLEDALRFSGRNIGYEDYGMKLRPWNTVRAGKMWNPVVKSMGCGWPVNYKKWVAAPRNNFVVSTDRILSWPKCKYQWLLHLLHFPPPGASLDSMKMSYELFEHTYGILFSCQPRATGVWAAHNKWPGLANPHYVCYGTNMTAEI